METNIKEQFKNELLLLYREAYFAKAQYILLENTYNILLRNTSAKYALSAIFDSLEFSVLLKLTKIYDADPDKESITLFHILNKVQSCKELNNNNTMIKKRISKIIKEVNDKDKEIEKIKICRDKVVSHIDKKYPKGLLSLKQEESINFKLLQKYSNYAYETLKEIYEIVFQEILLDTRQFEILKLEYENIMKNINKDIK